MGPGCVQSYYPLHQKSFHLQLVGVIIAWHRNVTATSSSPRTLRNCISSDEMLPFKMGDYIKSYNKISKESICIVNALTSVAAMQPSQISGKPVGQLKERKQRDSLLSMQINLKSLSRLSVLQS